MELFHVTFFLCTAIMSHSFSWAADSSDCDFESDLCSWTQDTAGWTRTSGASRNAGTGPSGGKQGGSYLYFDGSSGGPKRKAVIENDVFYPANEFKCLRFWYHMDGRDMGTLNLRFGDIRPATKSYVNWTVSGDQGAGWHRAQLLVNNDHVFNMMFEAIKGNGPESDIAIDDIYFADGMCAAQCDFEHDSCDWFDDSTDTWSRGRAKDERTLKDGPATDHTTGDGHYMYYEFSSQRSETASLRSSTVYPHGYEQCLTFWYHMYDPNGNMGSLEVLVDGRRVWKRDYSFGDEWRKAVVQLDELYTYDIVMEAYRDSSNWGGRAIIAVDDINLVNTSCPIVCDFEDDDCSWDLGSDWKSEKSSRGPLKDHTNSTGDGYYLYTEKTSKDTIYIKSPKKIPGNTHQCMTFWYQMRGGKELNVFMKEAEFEESHLWKSSGSLGDSWNRAQISFWAYSEFYAIIELIAGSGNNEVAIDDIEIRDGYCPVSCDFDIDMCNRIWHQDHNDDFDWIRGSEGNGPVADHTHPGGHYIYLDASSPKQTNDTAIFYTSEIHTKKRVQCFSFWYFMHGAGTGSLNVHKQRYSYPGETIWSMSGDQGDGEQWTLGQVTIRRKRAIPYTIMFEGVVGDSEDGNIAIDDIEIQDGPCPGDSYEDTPTPQQITSKMPKSTENTEADSPPSTPTIPSLETSNEYVEIVSSEPSISVGVTQAFSINCTVQASKFPADLSGGKVVSLVMSKWSEPKSSFQELISGTSPVGVKSLNDLGATTSWRIEENAESFISLEWYFPDMYAPGTYACEVTIEDSTGHNVLSQVGTEIRIESADPQSIVSTVMMLKKNLVSSQEACLSTTETLESSLKFWKKKAQILEKAQSLSGTLHNVEVDDLYLFTSKETFKKLDEAQVFCNNLGGQLVEATEQQLMDALTNNVLTGAPDAFYWIGWKWDGTAWTYTSSGEPVPGPTYHAPTAGRGECLKLHIPDRKFQEDGCADGGERYALCSL